MKDFKPNYNKCVDSRKELVLNDHICRYCFKDIYIYCSLYRNKECIAWKGYKHEC